MSRRTREEVSPAVVRTKAGVRQLLEGVSRRDRLEILADVLADLDFTHTQLVYDDLMRVVTGKRWPARYAGEANTKFLPE